jgi:hypothetical protein
MGACLVDRYRYGFPHWRFVLSRLLLSFPPSKASLCACEENQSYSGSRLSAGSKQESGIEMIGTPVRPGESDCINAGEIRFDLTVHSRQQLLITRGQIEG